MAKVEQALTTPELAKVVREVEPAAFVVPGRIVRRAIKHDRGLPTLLFRVPHRLVYTIGGETALKVVDRDELGLPEGEPPPETVILIAEPEPDELADRTPAELLREYWRRLFHARVHVELERRFADGTIGPASLRERIRRIEPSAFEEARSVLRQEDYLLPPRADSGVYVEFAAVYLTLRAFADHLIPRFSRRSATTTPSSGPLPRTSTSRPSCPQPGCRARPTPWRFPKSPTTSPSRPTSPKTSMRPLPTPVTDG